MSSTTKKEEGGCCASGKKDGNAGGTCAAKKEECKTSSGTCKASSGTCKAAESAPAAAPANVAADGIQRNAAGKKICCACPETKKARDECVVRNGKEACSVEIEKHFKCLRDEGFTITAKDSF